MQEVVGARELWRAQKGVGGAQSTHWQQLVGGGGEETLPSTTCGALSPVDYDDTYEEYGTCSVALTSSVLRLLTSAVMLNSPLST